MSRISKDKYFLKIAEVVAMRSTCARRAVGCVIVDQNYRIMSTGHNGVPPGIEHCIDNPCDGAQCPSGTGLDRCQATHAEINALLFCDDVMKVNKIYSTLFPCISCIKAILTSSCNEIIFKSGYNVDNDAIVTKLCETKGVKLTWIL